MPAQWVIHTVSPVWQDGNHGEDELLASCYRRCLELAKQHGIKMIAFPAISTGIYRFPLPRATTIAITQVKTFLLSNSTIEQVIFVCFDSATYDCYQSIIQEIVP